LDRFAFNCIPELRSPISVIAAAGDTILGEDKPPPIPAARQRNKRRTAAAMIIAKPHPTAIPIIVPVDRLEDESPSPSTFPLPPVVSGGERPRGYC